MRRLIFGLRTRRLGSVASPFDLSVGKRACVEPYDKTSQDLWLGSGASPPWNEVQSHCHSHESELLFV